MEAKIKKEFIIVIGTNDEKKTEEDLLKGAFELEKYGNSMLNLRFHISEKE